MYNMCMFLIIHNLNDIEIFTVEVLEEECKKVENDDTIISEKRFVLELDICCIFYFSVIRWSLFTIFSQVKGCISNDQSFMSLQNH